MGGLDWTKIRKEQEEQRASDSKKQAEAIKNTPQPRETTPSEPED